MEEVCKELLPHPTFQRLPKEEFLQRLEAVFDCFTSAGDTFLYAEPGMCYGLCFPRCKGYSFIGNKSKQFIHLIFEENMDNSRSFELLDIIECGSFLNYNTALKFKEKITCTYAKAMDIPPLQFHLNC